MENFILNKNSASIGKRNNWIDYLKIIAIIFVIITHDPWMVENSESVLCVLIIDMAVPIFMIVSGYNYAYSCQRRNIKKIGELYRWKDIKERLLRFLVPFEILYIIEVLLLIIFKHEDFSIGKWIINMIMGGYGPGAYYTPIMIQFTFIVPVIYYFINTYKSRAWLGIFFVNFLYECLYTFLNVSESFYSRCICRYLFLIAIGVIWRELWQDNNKKLLLLSFLVGIFYLIGAVYVWEPLIFRRWTSTSMMVGFYLFPLIVLFKTCAEQININKRINNIIVLCSKATFHIYLFQMLYYYAGVERIFESFPLILQIVSSVLVCIFGGCIFYLLTSLFFIKRGKVNV